MEQDATGHGDDSRETRGRLTRFLVAGAITAASAAAVVGSGAASYAAGAGKKPPPASDQYRPGWGCGDKNHVHTGPPGRQYAPPPPGCRR